MPLITIDVTSDLICPWCYIGKRRLEKAIQEFQSSHKVDFSVKWYPYQLLPDAPQQSLPKREAIEKRFGAERAVEMMNSIVHLGIADGIQFNPDGNTGNTFLAHCLIYYAQRIDKQNTVVEILFQSYFELALDITKITTLVDIATKAGLNRDHALEFLDSPLEKQRVRDLLSKYRPTITGVPHYSINQTIQVSGAQSSETFVKLFQKILRS